MPAEGPKFVSRSIGLFKLLDEESATIPPVYGPSGSLKKEMLGPQTRSRARPR
jgi:hypothetical protein